MEVSFKELEAIFLMKFSKWKYTILEMNLNI